MAVIELQRRANFAVGMEMAVKDEVVQSSRIDVDALSFGCARLQHFHVGNGARELPLKRVGRTRKEGICRNRDLVVLRVEREHADEGMQLPDTTAIPGADERHLIDDDISLAMIIG